MVRQNCSRELTSFSTIMPQPFPPCTLEKANVLSFDNLASSNWPVSPHRKLSCLQYQYTSGEWAAHCSCFPLELILALHGEKVNWGRNPLCLFPSKLNLGTEEREGNVNDPSILYNTLICFGENTHCSEGDPLWLSVHCPWAILGCQPGAPIPAHFHILSSSLGDALPLDFIWFCENELKPGLVSSNFNLKCSYQCLGLDFLL